MTCRDLGRRDDLPTPFTHFLVEETGYLYQIDAVDEIAGISVDTAEGKGPGCAARGQAVGGLCRLAGADGGLILWGSLVACSYAVHIWRVDSDSDQP
jgi:hypothetical protein